MIRRIINLSAAFLATTLLFGLSAGTASADVASLEIGTIGYNAIGPDTYANRNAEYIDIKNTSESPVSVKDLVIEDSWRHGQPARYTGPCNGFTVTSLPAADGTPTTDLPGKHTLRVYVGEGPSKVFGTDGTIHPVYMNSPDACGYHGQFLNNNPPKIRNAPWDTVWISQGGVSKSKAYAFQFTFTTS